MVVPVKFSVRLSDDAHRGLDRYTTAENVTMTALLEAFCRELHAGWKPPKRMVDEAHRIDRERRSR